MFSIPVKGDFILPVAQPKILGVISVSLLSLSHPIWSLSHPVLCNFKTFPYLDPILTSLSDANQVKIIVTSFLVNIPPRSIPVSLHLMQLEVPFTDRWIKSFFYWKPFNGLLSCSEEKRALKSCKIQVPIASLTSCHVLPLFIHFTCSHLISLLFIEPTTHFPNFWLLFCFASFHFS